MSHYLFNNKIYEKGSGRLFQVLGQHLEELDPLSLTQQSYLNYIIDKKAEIATFDELTQLEGKLVNNNTVSQHISKIKKIVGCDIENVPRQGYRLRSIPSLVDIGRYKQPFETVAAATPPNKTMATFVIVLLLLCVSAWFFVGDQQGVVIESHEKASMMQGSESHGVLSPDGQFLAFEYRKLPGQLNHLWIKNLTTQQKQSLTLSQIGVDDEISAFSSDGRRLLFHRTYQQKICSVNEIVFNSFSPLSFTEKKLFACQDGYKSINAEYGKDINEIYFTDYGQFEQGHNIFRYDRFSNEISEIFSLPKSGQGLYRVYPLPKANDLIMLSTDDWSVTQIYQLTLSTNKLQHLVDVPSALESIAIDGDAFYYLGQREGEKNSVLSRFSLVSHQASHTVLPRVHDSFLSISKDGKQLAIDGKTTNAKKIVKLVNPLKNTEYAVVEDISSSGSDSLPLSCGESVYFFSNRSGRYNLWRKSLIQDEEVQVFGFAYVIIPKDYSFSPDCTKVAVVEDSGRMRLVDLALQQSLYHSTDRTFLNAKWLKDDELLVCIVDDGYHLTRFYLTGLRFERISVLPDSKAYLLAKSNSQLWLLQHKDNALMVYDFKTQTKRNTGHNIELFRNSSWVNWQDKGIYYYLDNQINPVLAYIGLDNGVSKQITLPKSHKNAHFTMAQDSDAHLWMVKNKSPQRDIYQYKIK